MPGEQPPTAQFSDEQLDLADFFLETCGLQAEAGRTLSMMGQFGTVRDGLARCAHHLLASTPEEINAMVNGMLKDQGSTTEKNA